jgi:aminoglycoside phosphotransferase (APT) family kinase protein
MPDSRRFYLRKITPDDGIVILSANPDKKTEQPMNNQKVERGLDRVGAVWDGYRFDVARLADYCAKHLAGFVGPLEVAQFHGGASNPTFLLTDLGTARRFVMRKKPPGVLLPSAHAIEREYRIMHALNASAVPVPQMLLLVDDVEIVGTAFYLMSFLDGRIYKDNLLIDMSPLDRRAAYRNVASTLAALHALDPSAIGLGDLGRGGNYYSRQLSRWTRQYRETQTETIAAMDELIDLLPTAIPADDSFSLVHGDYRLENVMFAPNQPQVIAVLDWELSTLGHPLADVAFFCLFYHADFMDWGSNATIDFDTTGIPREAEFVRDYCAASGHDRIDNWAFYLSFSAFRLASIAQGVQKRARDGLGAALRDERSGSRSWAELSLKLLREGNTDQVRSW